jgi:hypothetical protein
MTIEIVLLFVFSIWVYLLPGLFGVLSKKDGINILIINILLGWTIVGWAIALIWALREEKI